MIDSNWLTIGCGGIIVKLLNQIFANKPLRLLNHTNIQTLFDTPYDAQVSFAIEDAIATTVGDELVPKTIRLWTHEPTLVLGIPDSRLVDLEAGVRYMKDLHYDVIVRNSGGLAVLLDRNVLNISFILPNKDSLSIHEGYDIMYAFTEQLFAPEQAHISAYEIVGSYCPGDYDLSIEGKKFAGISQRRVRNGVAIQMYLDIAGSSFERADIVRKFYELAKADVTSSFPYPEVNPSVMASINELLQTDFTVDNIINRIEHTFTSIAQTPLDRKLIAAEKPLFMSRLGQMHKRNEIISTYK